MPSASPTVFISYSHKDKDLLVALAAQLKTLEQAGLLEVWVDTRIDAGDKWYPEIEGAMRRAAVAVCLVSEHFLASSFCTKQEVPFLLKRSAEDSLLIVPVLLSDCVWQSHRWLEETQILPGEGQSVRTHFPQNPAAAFVKVAKRIYDKLSDPSYKPPTSLPSWPPLPTGQIDVTHLPETGKELFGRDEELERLDQAWASQDAAATNPTRIVAFTAQGGVGKSTLVNHWLAEMRADNFRGARRVYGWSFYSQGVRDETGASADAFIDAALRFFGDSDPTAGSPWDKGSRLAGLVGNQRSLLILDGLEPLQSGHTFDRGKLRDPALESLLRSLARHSNGLCLITTREPLPDLNGHLSVTIRDLEQITPQAGRALLRTARVIGTDAELESLATRFGPHALAISLLGVYLREQPGHGIGPAKDLEDLPGEKPVDRVLAGFERWLGNSQEWQALRLLGFFDRPADPGCLRALRQPPAIPALTDYLTDVSDAEWDRILTRLEALQLLHLLQCESVSGYVDAHPLIREYFAAQLVSSHTWPEGNRRIYEHLCTTTHEGAEPSFAKLQPLYQAVHHGCAAGFFEAAFSEVYMRRIQQRRPDDPYRRECYFSWDRFGAVSLEFATLTNFLMRPHSQPVSHLSEQARSHVLALVGFALHSMGRLADATAPMDEALQLRIQGQDWRSAATSAGDLSDHHRIRGNLRDARRYACQAVRFTRKTNDPKEHMLRWANVGVVRHQQGRWHLADLAYHKVSQAQNDLANDPSIDECVVLYARRGFHISEFWLDAVAELVEFQLEFRATPPEKKIPYRSAENEHGSPLPLRGIPEFVTRQTKTALNWIGHDDLLAIGLGRLTLGRALCLEVLINVNSLVDVRDPKLLSSLEAGAKCVEQALATIRNTGYQDFLVHGLLTRAWLRFLMGSKMGPDSAQSDLDEAWEIAERGLMRLHMADVHLYRARLFFREPVYPFKNEDGSPRTPADDLAAAEKLINTSGYHRRDQELADAKHAILKQ